MTADQAHKSPVHAPIHAMTKRHTGIILSKLVVQNNIAVSMLLVCILCYAVEMLTVDELLDGAFLDQGMPASRQDARGAAAGQRNVKGDISTLCSEMHDFCTAFKCSSTCCCRHSTARKARGEKEEAE